MKPLATGPLRRASLATFTCLAFAVAPAALASPTTVTLDVDFEAPTFAPGAINGPTVDPQFSAGQGGWGGYSSAFISTAQARSGTQSLKTPAWTGVFPSVILRPLADTTYVGNPVPSGYPFTNFSIGGQQDWWVQAHVRISRGGSARMVLVNGLGGCPLLDIGSYLTADAGVPHANGCISDTRGSPLGDAMYDQWLELDMIHVAGGALLFRIIGNGIDTTLSLGAYGGPGSTSQVSYLGLAGDAYWDDVRAGYGSLPTDSTQPPGGSLPAPGTPALAALGLAAMAGTMRRRGAAPKRGAVPRPCGQPG